jgi:hypothetical protein
MTRRAIFSATVSLQSCTCLNNLIISIGLSKLANILFTAELQRRLDADNVPALSITLHPGGVSTGKPYMTSSHLRISRQALTRIVEQMEVKSI